MPPLPSPGQVVKLDWNYESLDAKATNIMYFAYSGAGAISPDELSDFGASTTMEATLAAPYIGASPDTANGTTSIYTDLSSDTGAVYEGGIGWTGTNTGSPAPASASVVVQDLILRRYRGGHPRTYMMVGLASDFAPDSIKTWQTAFLGNIQTGWNDFMAAFPLTIGSRTWTPVNVSYWTTVDGVRTLRETPLVDLIYQKSVKPRVCSQRRRLGKVGG